MSGKFESKKSQKNRWKRYANVIHLWLGFLTGVVVFIVAITGCIYVFQDEIKDMTHDWRHIERQDRAFIPPSVILKNVKHAYPAVAANMVVYQNGDRPASVFVSIDNVPHTIYINPYSGEITHLQNLDNDFFMIVEHLHRFLLLPEKIGKQVTGISTLIFLVMLITGLILWWPKRWKNAGQNFKIRWNARWRRKNYEWHRTTGFYMVLPAIVVALTGLSFSYEWVHDSFFYLGNIGNGETLERAVPSFEKNDKITANVALDHAMSQTRDLAPASGMYFVWDQGEGLPIMTGAYPESHAFDHQSNFFFDPESGKLLASQYYEDKSPGLKFQEMSYGLHTGQLLDLPGKIAAFTASLFVAALPVSGFLIWYGRRNKKKRKFLKNPPLQRI